MTDEYVGTVVKRPFAAGSKSEREAVVLSTPDGELLLRRQGGNPFVDPVLEGLVGKRLRCRGVLSGTTLIASDWTEE